MDFIQAINEAKKEAFKQAIMANAIFINKNFMATKPIMISLFRDVQIVKPMILGLKADITDELPDDVAFVITAVDEEKLMTEHERQIRKDTAKDVLQELYDIAKAAELHNTTNVTLYDIKVIAKKYDIEVDE